MKHTEEVSMIDLQNAITRWLSVHQEDLNGAKFWEEYLINYDHSQAGYFINRDGYLMTPEAANKIEALCGPHWFAVLKAYEARK